MIKRENWKCEQSGIWLHSSNNYRINRVMQGTAWEQWELSEMLLGEWQETGIFGIHLQDAIDYADEYISKQITFVLEES